MFRIDVYDHNGLNRKKIGSHWYSTREEAENAAFTLKNMPRKSYTYIPGENRKQVTRILGGYHVSKPIEDSKF